MPTISLDDTFTVYASEDDADKYLSGASHGVSWASLDDETKERALVTSTRILDRQQWPGTKTADDQPLQWPRTGTGITGVADDVIPQNVIDASIELALAITQGTDVQNQQSTAQTVSSLHAGSVSLSFFRGAEGEPYRFPLIVQELLRDYLPGIGSSTTPIGASAYGTRRPSSTWDRFDYSGSI